MFAVAVALGVMGWALGWFGDRTINASAVPTVTVTAPATEPTTATHTEDGTSTSTTSVTPSEAPATLTSREQRDQAFRELESIVASDAQRSPIRGQWVAQLASKYEGVVDKSQQSTPFTLVQILAEIEKLRVNPDYGSIVRVVHQGDWAKSTAGPTPLWVSFADIDVAFRADVTSWCDQHFSQRGKAQLNVCYPRQMNPR